MFTQAQGLDAHRHTGPRQSCHTRRPSDHKGVVKQKAAEQQNDSGGGGNFTYMDFKKMIDDAFPSEVNERDLMDYFMEWEERFESLFEDRVDENNEKAQEAAKEVKEMENAVNEAYTKALAEAEEKKKAAEQAELAKQRAIMAFDPTDLG